MTGQDPRQDGPGERPGAGPDSELPGELDTPAGRRWPCAVIAVLAVAAVVLGGLQYLPMLLSGSTQTDSVPPPAATSIPQPSSDPPPVGGGNGGGAPFTPAGFLRSLNEALAGADRERFFELVGPGAVDGLRLWWDNMAALGMSGGGLSMESGTLDGLARAGRPT